MNQKLEVKLVDMGTGSECKAASFLWQMPMYTISGLRCHAPPAHAFRQVMAAARNRVYMICSPAEPDQAAAMKAPG